MLQQPWFLQSSLMKLLEEDLEQRVWWLVCPEKVSLIHRLSFQFVSSLKWQRSLLEQLHDSWQLIQLPGQFCFDEIMKERRQIHGIQHEVTNWFCHLSSCLYPNDGMRVIFPVRIIESLSPQCLGQSCKPGNSHWICFTYLSSNILLYGWSTFIFTRFINSPSIANSN